MATIIISNIIFFTGQVGMGVGSWTSNLTKAGSIPGVFDYNCDLTQECRINL